MLNSVDYILFSAGYDAPWMFCQCIWRNHPMKLIPVCRLSSREADFSSIIFVTGNGSLNPNTIPFWLAAGRISLRTWLVNNVDRVVSIAGKLSTGRFQRFMVKTPPSVSKARQFMRNCSSSRGRAGPFSSKASRRMRS